MLGNVFNIFSIFYAFRGLQVAANVVRDWAKIRGPDFTPQLKSLAGQASFFLAVPISVFFHELSHALAVWLFGGQVVQFAYRVFWGFVVPDRIFSPERQWFIALAGTLGSLLFGVIVWLLFRKNASPTFRYFGLRAFHYQIFFSLIYYPVFTLMGFYGDWRSIYNFSATPILSGATAVFHAGTLLMFWRADRQGFFEMGAYISEEAKERIKGLENQVAASPYDPGLQLQLIEAYRQEGMPKEATQLAQQFLKDNPNSAEGHLQLAVLEAGHKEKIPEKAREEAQKAISLGLSRPEAVAAAYQILGRYDWSRKRIVEAIDHYSRAISALQETDKQKMLVSLLYHRGLAYRRQGQLEAAERDIRQAIQIAQSEKIDKDSVTILERELDTILGQSGRPFDPSKTSTPFR